MAQNATRAPFSALHLHAAKHPRSVAMLQTIGQLLRGWLSDDPKPLDVPTESGRLIESWGTLASDVAVARSARASAGFFDEPRADFWRKVSLEVHRRRSLSDLDRPSAGP